MKIIFFKILFLVAYRRQIFSMLTFIIAVTPNGRKWDGNYSVSVKLNGHNTGPCANANNFPLKLNLDIKDNYIMAKLVAQCSYLDGFVSGRIKNDGKLNLILEKQVAIYGQRNKAGAIGSERFFTQISGRIDGKIVINSNYNLASISRTEIRF